MLKLRKKMSISSNRKKKKISNNNKKKYLKENVNIALILFLTIRNDRK